MSAPIPNDGIPNDGILNVFTRFIEWITPSNSPSPSSPPSPTNTTPSHSLSLSEGVASGIWYINIHTGEKSFVLRGYSEAESWILV